MPAGILEIICCVERKTRCRVDVGSGFLEIVLCLITRSPARHRCGGDANMHDGRD
jgi:hypothetical protein